MRRGNPGQTSFIQIKSRRTHGGKGSALKLSNAVRFAQRAHPCFVVLYELDGDALEPSAIYVQHFWTDQIHEALAAPRRAHVAGRTDLNRIAFPNSLR